MIKTTSAHLVAKIKEKKELMSLDDSYVTQHVNQELTPHIKDKMARLSPKQFFRSQEFDDLKSKVRKRLRETYGVFSHEHMNKKELLTRLVNEDQELVIRQLLNLHQSTQERIPYYSIFYEQLFAITGCHPRIFDIGCGLNPLSYPFMKCNARIICCDISSDDVAFLNEYFAIMNIDGRAIPIDALNQKKIDEVIQEEKPEIIFLLKVADTLESLKRHSSKKLVARLLEQTLWVVVSFPTVSLGGGKVIHDDRRSWFENFLEKSGYENHTFSLPNEKVYVIKGLEE